MNFIKESRELIPFFKKYLSKSDVYFSRAKAELSAKILSKRLDMKMNQKDFAAYMEVSQGMISKWESCEYNFTFRTAAEICEKLGLVFDVDIVGEKEYLNSKYPIAENWQCKSVKVSSENYFELEAA